MNCAQCKLWQESAKGKVGWRNGLGRCNNVPNFWDATKQAAVSDMEDGYAAERELKPEYKAVKAFGLDDTGYQAFLVTSPDFGCVSFIQKGMQQLPLKA